MFDIAIVQNVAEQPQRIETGPVQFRGDWPGLFIRGDDCVHLAASISTLTQWLQTYGSRPQVMQVMKEIGDLQDLKAAMLQTVGQQ